MSNDDKNWKPRRVLIGYDGSEGAEDAVKLARTLCRGSGGCQVEDETGAEQLDDDVAGQASPGEGAAHGEGERDDRVQVRAGDRPHEEDASRAPSGPARRPQPAG